MTKRQKQVAIGISIVVIAVLGVAAGIFVMRQQETNAARSYFTQVGDLSADQENIENGLAEADESETSGAVASLDTVSSIAPIPTGVFNVNSGLLSNLANPSSSLTTIDQMIAELQAVPAPVAISADVAELIAALQELKVAVQPYAESEAYFNTLTAIYASLEAELAPLTGVSQDPTTLLIEFSAAFNRMVAELNAMNVPESMHTYHVALVTDMTKMSEYMDRFVVILAQMNAAVATSDLTTMTAATAELQVISNEMAAYQPLVAEIPALTQIDYTAHGNALNRASAAIAKIEAYKASLGI